MSLNNPIYASELRIKMHFAL